MNGAVPARGAAVAVAVTAVLLLTGCGSEQAGPAAGGTRTGGGPSSVTADPLCPSGEPRYGAAPTDDPSAGTVPRPPRNTPASPASPASPMSRRSLPLPTGTAAARDGVRITALTALVDGSGQESRSSAEGHTRDGEHSGIDDRTRDDGRSRDRHGCTPALFSADFAVTNHEPSAMTYTVTLGFLSSSGGAVGTAERTVVGVGPGRTVRSAAELGAVPGDPPAVAGVSIMKVRGVPAAEAPANGDGPCPASGVRLYADQGDAAMGLRVVGLHLENCGPGTYRLDGRPRLRILDADRKPVTGVSIVRGEDIATGTGADGTPRPLALHPGERALAVLTWRNTTQAGTAVEAPYVRVWPAPGARPVLVTPELDLGTTGKLGVGPWKRVEDTGR
ncbi:DUF4232 domain-containing protein [Streptomyces sp. NPDC059688]|uniref:DUF4232 domain-containing protein n=1 Tax=Streptomyces sp. NPDC059688 TaxID=3346906 RepID=UPI0036BA1713